MCWLFKHIANGMLIPLCILALPLILIIRMWPILVSGLVFWVVHTMLGITPGISGVLTFLVFCTCCSIDADIDW